MDTDALAEIQQLSNPWDMTINQVLGFMYATGAAEMNLGSGGEMGKVKVTFTVVFPSKLRKSEIKFQ